jgi:ubiquinone/menaquinone biosynthesis C-methylase UbiE
MYGKLRLMEGCESGLIEIPAKNLTPLKGPWVRIPPLPPKNFLSVVRMDQKTIDTYNSMALEYDEETIDFWERFPRTFLDKFIALNPGGKVLDIGAGPGRDGLLLQQGGLDVICLDASEAMVKLSIERGLESVLGDFLDMPFTDASFDAVWAYTVLLHVPKSEVNKAMQEVRRVLKPNGHLALGLIEGDYEGYRDSSGVSAPRLLQQHQFQIVYFEQFRPRSKNYLNFISQNQLAGSV